MYTVKGLKRWNTHEGGGFQVVLLRDGKPVAEVTNEGIGACFIFQWKDKPSTTVTARNLRGEEMTYRGTPEEAALWAHILTLPAVEDRGQRFAMDPDMFVEELVNDLELERQLKRWLKSPTFIEDGKIYRLAGPMRPSTSLTLKAHRPNAVLLNDLLPANAIKAVKALQTSR